jgi:hypothetical protein
MPLTATADPGHHHFATDVVYFYMNNGNQRVRCGVSRLALELLEPDPPTHEAGPHPGVQPAPSPHRAGRYMETTDVPPLRGNRRRWPTATE